VKELINETVDFSDLKEVLERVVTYNNKNTAFSNIIFNLKNGRELVSCPYKVVTTRIDSFYYCLDWDFNSRSQSTSLSIIPLSEITLLSIPNFEAVSEIFIKGNTAAIVTGSLQLNRLIEQTGVSISTMVGQTISVKLEEVDSENEKANLYKVLQLLPDVFKELIVDDFSKKEVSEKLNLIKIKGGSELLTSLEGKTLVIQCNSKEAVVNFKLKKSLIEHIEKNL
jgi:hypothetical protein